MVRKGPVRVLQGRTRDLGCSLTGIGKLRSIQVAVAKAGRCSVAKASKKAKGSQKAKRTLPSSTCSARWLRAKGSASWTVRLSRPLTKGVYTVRIRAVDSAGNIEKPRAVRLTVR
jgi:hypothetical protein